MQKQTSRSSIPRIPPEHGGIQVNFCKNPACENYGIPAAQSTGHGAQRDRYAVVGAGRQFPVLKCHGCGEYPPLKSNQGVAEERDRLGAYLGAPEASCPDTDCANHGVGISTGTPHYRSYGVTKSGSKRYRCNACTKTFSVGTSTVGQRQPHKNRLIFQLLMNKSPLRRICEIADIAPGTLYPKLDFLHRQCLAFVGHRERYLLQGFSIPRLYIGIDRQDYVVNWTRREDKRNVQLTAVGSADNTTRYVFGMHLNFDPDMESALIEDETAALGDREVQMPFRRHARLWLASDYAVSRQQNKNAQSSSGNVTLNGAVATRYQVAESRSDVEVFEEPGRTTQLPKTGMQVHAEYTLYGHCFLLQDLTAGAEKIRLFLDQDSGMRAAALGAFAKRVANRTADVFYVRINKDMTVDERKHALRDSREHFHTLEQKHPTLDHQTLQLLIIQEALANMAVIGRWKDRWLTHPFPNMSEPEKAVCYLTNYDDYDDGHLAWLYNKASLRAIDGFFMQVRRRLSLLERPIATASNNRRTWYGYSAYNPRSIVKLLEMFRVFYNYVLIGLDKQTPAMRLGLAERPITLEEIVHFHP